MAEEDSEAFGEMFDGALPVPGKIAGLLGDIEAGGQVTFPIELDKVRWRR